MLLSAKSILDANDLAFEDVDVPEWGGSVRIATMSATARDAFESSILSTKNKITTDNIRAKLLARCLVDDKGDLLFKDADVEKLGKKNSKVVDKLFAIAQKLNGIGNQEVEELAKN